MKTESNRSGGRAEWLRTRYADALACAETADLSACVLSMLESLPSAGGEDRTIAEAAITAVRTRLDPAACAHFVEAIPDGASPALLWARARLRARSGDPASALRDWDGVVERGIGPHFERHLERAQARLRVGDAKGAGADLREALRHPVDFARMERAGKLYRKLPCDQIDAQRRIRIGLLGGFTTQILRPLLEIACFRDGIAAELYEAEYGVFRQEVLDPTSGLHRFRPDVVILATSWRDAQLPPLHPDPDEAVRSLVDGFAALWRVCNQTLGAHVIQHAFDLPPAESQGHLGHALSGGRSRILLRANLALYDAAGAGVSILDFPGVAARAGMAAWSDPGLWYLAKQHPGVDALPLLATEYTAHLRALYGLSRKVLVLDLDNTLWGGVIGEDGLDGILLGGHSPEGEAHADLQRYALELRERGIALAVCSKNNDADAREPFEKHPEMQLRLDHIAVFRANWQDKVTNLREIAATLGVGTDSLVFVDDNPTERAWVRRELPEVAVPEIGDDPSRYAEILHRERLFEALALSDEDRLRAEAYAANARRAELESSVTDLGEFLASLDMVAQTRAFDEANLPRIAQLVNKSNQFNLTTRRYTQEQLRSLAADPTCIARCFRLRDRFGDNGLIGVMIGRVCKEERKLEIDTWLMSCRVLGRRMEEFMCGELMRAAQAAGVDRIVGRYLPTRKNALVRDLYVRMGFRPLGDGETAGETLWEYDLRAQPPLRSEFIRIED